MAQIASDVESLQGYSFTIIWKGIWYVISEFIGHYFDTFLTKRSFSKFALFRVFNINPDLSGKKAFPWSEKTMVCVMNTVPCKMLIRLILDGLLGG